MNLRRLILSLFLFVTVVAILNAQVARQTGVIKGIVTDNEGNPLPGGTLTTFGPALMGSLSDTTDNKGAFRLPGLPPGVYTVTAELPGFKAVKRGNVIVRVGMVVTINIQTEPTTIKEEVTVVAPSPIVDIQASKIRNIITTEIMERLPLNRNFTDIFNTVPGAAGTIQTYSGSIHGATSTTVTFELDGVNANCPTTGGSLMLPHWDTMEEIEIVTGGLPAQVGNTGGSYINIVTKAGGNEFHGSTQVYYTNEDLTDILMSDEQLRAMGIGKPESPIYDWDVSGTLGGPIIKDKIWFFLDIALLKSKRHGGFIPTTIWGTRYDPFDLPQSTWEGMAKITAQLSKSLRFFAMFHGDLYDRDVYNYWETTVVHDATFTLQNNWVITGSANLTWLLGPDTFVDFRLGLVNRWFPITSRPETDANECYRDGYTGYVWNGIHTWQSKIRRHTKQASVRLTHFMDDFLGGDHEFGAGVEYVWGRDYYGYERTNPLTWWYYDGNPYYYRGLYGLTGPHPSFGDGLVSFTNCGANPDDSWKGLIVTWWAFYLQDAFTIQKRFTINAGLRLDSYNGYMGDALTTGTTGLSFEIGQTFEPSIGFNPYGPFEMEPIKDVMVFTTISPRIGVTYDLFGDGKTALKLAYSRYYEHVPVMRFAAVSPDVLAMYEFNWWDLNNNGQLDSPPIDRYDPRWGSGQFSIPDPDYLFSRVDPDLESPYYDEVVASINHELSKDFSVKLQYLYKRGRNLHGWALCDAATGEPWYSLDQAPEWWVPFTTIVPEFEDYPEQEVTVYFRTQDSPWDRQLWKQMNIPEAKIEYHAVELSFDKRFSKGWSLGGSIVLSQHKLLIPEGGPNAFVNGYGKSDNNFFGYDLPLAIKLFGSFELPYGFITSFFYHRHTGYPFTRTVTVVPPSAWATAHNTLEWSEWVKVEEVDGSRRNQSYDNIDLRLEKEFHFPFGRIGLFMDIYNLLGARYLNYGQEPGGTWMPVDENTNVGTFTPGWSYGRLTSIEAARIFKFSVRFTF